MLLIILIDMMEDQRDISFSEFWSNFETVITRHGKQLTDSKWNKIKDFAFETWIDCSNQNPKKRKHEPETQTRIKKRKPSDPIILSFMIFDANTGEKIIIGEPIQDNSHLIIYIKNPNEERINIKYDIQNKIIDKDSTFHFLDLEVGESMPLCAIKMVSGKCPICLNIESKLASQINDPRTYRTKISFITK